MKKFQSIRNFYKKNSFILFLILAVFFLKGLLLSTIIPIFNGFDEARHYNTIQYLAEPKEKNWEKNETEKTRTDKDLVQSFNYTEEIKKTAEKIRCVGGEDRCNPYANNLFGPGFYGKNEAEINSQTWKKYNIDYPVNIASSGKSLYHKLGAEIEKILGEKSILIRFYLLRIFSVLFGTIAIFIFYLIFKTAGFSPKHSLLLSTIISFQPRFSFYYAYINYDCLLILFFALFTFGAVLSIKNGLNWKNIFLMLASIFLGTWVKETSLILLAVFVFLISFLGYKKLSKKTNIKAIYWLFLFLTVSLLIIAMTLEKYLPLIGNFSEIISSFGKYFMKNIDLGLITLSSKTYWGILPFGNWLSNNLLSIIWVIEFISLAGLFIFIFGKNKPDFLPEKKYIVFFILMIIALQVGIRLADWQFFALNGKLEIQTPGRYFFPNLALHIALVFVGLGAVLKTFKKEKYFDFVLSLGLILMFLFFIYHLLNLLLEFYL